MKLATWQLALILFVCVENVLIFAMCTQAKSLHEDTDALNAHLEKVDRSLGRVERNFDEILRDVRALQVDGGVAVQH